MKKLKVAMVSAVLSVAAVAVLVQCAPKKDKEGDKKNASLVEGIDFSALEKSENSPSAKALLQTLKDGRAADAQTLATALIELHVKAEKSEAKAAEIKETTDKTLEKVMKMAESIKAQKPEELKKSYKLIEEEQKKTVRYIPSAVSILNVLEKGEIQDYSGTSLLALLWLKTPGLNRTNAAVVVEDKQLKLAEVRTDKKIISIDSTNKCPNGRDEGTAEELVKGGQKKKILSLDLFLIHEALKPFAADSKAWALKIQKASNKSMSLKIEEKDLTTNAGADKSKLGQSELLIGVLREKPVNDLESESCTASTAKETDSANKNGANDPSKDKADPAGKTEIDKPAADAEGAGKVAPIKTLPKQDVPQQPAGNDKPAPAADVKAPGFVRVQSDCQSVEKFTKSLPDGKGNDLMALFATLLPKNKSFMSSAKSYLLMNRLEALEISELAGLDSDFAKIAKDAVQESESKKVRMVLVVKPTKEEKNLSTIWMFEKDSNKFVDTFAPTKEGVNMAPKAVEYLKSKARSTQVAEDKRLIIEMKNQDTCLQ